MKICFIVGFVCAACLPATNYVGNPYTVKNDGYLVEIEFKKCDDPIKQLETIIDDYGGRTLSAQHTAGKYTVNYVVNEFFYKKYYTQELELWDCIWYIENPPKEVNLKDLQRWPA